MRKGDTRPLVLGCLIAGTALLLVLPLFLTGLDEDLQEASSPEEVTMADSPPPSPTDQTPPPPESRETGAAPAAHEAAAAREAPDPREAAYVRRRHEMVERQLRRRDITEERVLAAMEKVPRHRFVPAEFRGVAYTDGALPIEHGQTISQPYIVALMTQLARPRPEARALDVGTGSGYQAAVLAELVAEVFGIEILCPLAEQAAERLAALGYANVEVRCGDGYRGWAEQAPFDLIILAAAPDHIPQPLVDQLAPGGRLVLPVGDVFQELVVVEKQADGTVKQWESIPVRFVPMTGEAGRR